MSTGHPARSFSRLNSTVKALAHWAEIGPAWPDGQEGGGSMPGRSSADLQQALTQAKENYEASWQPVDAELYDLCRRRSSQRTFADVYTKVAIVGRIYEAGIVRAARSSGHPEAEVARGLTKQADLLDEALHVLAHSQFDRATAAQIIELHGRVSRGLLPHTGDVWLTSFVSKYLHFHCNIVPVYDSTAAGRIGHFVDWDIVAEVRAPMMDLPDWARAYRNYVAAFVVLYERAWAETELRPSVRDIDYLLWQPAPDDDRSLTERKATMPSAEIG
jgi:hypothetical protein